MLELHQNHNKMKRNIFLVMYSSVPAVLFAFPGTGTVKYSFVSR